MTSRDFCYWLQGFFELASCSDDDGKGRPQDKLSRDQVQTLKRHLEMVFQYEIDPSFGDKKQQEDLAKTHGDIETMLTGVIGGPPKFNC